MALEFYLKNIKDNQKEKIIWNASFFKEYLSLYDKKIIENNCAMERFMLQLLGLSLKKKENSNGSLIDFSHFCEIFKESINILNEIFNSNIFGIYLTNAFNITAPNFIKNLVFNGGPKINPGIVSIKDKGTLETIIKEFNQSFNKIGVFIDKKDVKVECIEEIKKIKHIYNNKKSLNEHEKTLKNTIKTYCWIEDIII